MRRSIRLGLGWTILILTACSEGGVAPKREPQEPTPLPDPRAVRLWIYATGLVLDPGESFQQGFTVDEPAVSHDYYTYPGSIPAAYRVAWWSSDSEVVSVDPLGRIVARGTGRAGVWVQVESARDSAAVRVGPGESAAPVRYASVYAGGAHSCGLTETGRAYCWGSDAFGKLGRGVVRWWTSAAAPGPVVGDQRFIQLALSGDHTCGLVADGSAWCWGYNLYGQLGNGELDRDDTLAFASGVPQPARVKSAVAFDTLVTSAFSTCALDVEGAAYCWGWNVFGELGIGAVGERLGVDVRAEPVAVAGGLRFRMLSRGIFHLCGVTYEGLAYCWGLNNRGQLGNDVAEPCQWACSSRPVPVNTDLEFTAIAGGFEHTCALTSDGRAYCWGGNGGGVLGNDSLERSITPVPVSTDLRFVSITSSSGHVCALTASGNAYCWGGNDYGQLGRGERNFVANPTPQLVQGGLRFNGLAAGLRHTCGATVEGDAYCWGVVGLLGNGKIGPTGGVGTAVMPSPVKVVEPM